MDHSTSGQTKHHRNFPTMHGLYHILLRSSAQHLYPPQYGECLCSGFAEAVSVLLLDSCCYCYNIVVFFVQTLDGFRWIWLIRFVGAAGARSEADAGQFGGWIMFGRMTERWIWCCRNCRWRRHTRQELLGVRVVFLFSLVSHFFLRERNLKCRALGPAEGGCARHLRFLDAHTCQSHIIHVSDNLIVIFLTSSLFTRSTFNCYSVGLEILICTWYWYVLFLYWILPCVILIYY